MIPINLTDRHREILRALCHAAAKGNRPSIERVIGNTADVNDIDVVCNVINAEYLMHGIERSYEPNTYGRELNELLNTVNRPRLTRPAS